MRGLARLAAVAFTLDLARARLTETGDESGSKRADVSGAKAPGPLTLKVSIAS